MDDKDNFKFDDDTTTPNEGKLPRNENTNKPNWLEQNSSDNPFDNNPFKDSPPSSTESQQPEYKIDNERIRANRNQTNSLARVLLALLASIGLLVAAIWGLTHSNKNNTNSPQSNINLAQNDINAAQKAPSPQTNSFLPKPANLKEGQDFCSLSLADDYKQKYLPMLEAERRQTENELFALEEKENLTPEEEMRLEALQAHLDELDSNIAEAKETNALSCRLDEAQKYIAQSIGNLDRVAGKIEEKAAEAKESKNQEQIKFLKGKLESLSRAEAEVRAFSQPYLQKDLTIGFGDQSAPCKVKDAPKYLAAWLDQVKDRINALQTNLSQNPEEQQIQAKQEEKQNNIQSKPESQTKQSETKPQLAWQEPKVKAPQTTVKQLPQSKPKQKNSLSQNITKTIKNINKPSENSIKKAKPQSSNLNSKSKAQTLVASENTSKQLNPISQNVQQKPQAQTFNKMPETKPLPEVIADKPIENNKKQPKASFRRPIERCYEEDYYDEEENTCEEPEIYYEDCGRGFRRY